ncbi:hypothetical protein MMC28_010714 [Mycoblastus sanguinarius]|nr:hypothetical protein [Mycoblastus sanguinarius]
MTLVGTVKDKICILVDDMADTCKSSRSPPNNPPTSTNKPPGGTLVKAADTLKANGAASVVAIVTHGIFSGAALETLNKCEALSRVVATNTVPFAAKKQQCPKLEEIDVSPTLAEACRRTHNGESVSFLFSHAPMD